MITREHFIVLVCFLMIGSALSVRESEAQYAVESDQDAQVLQSSMIWASEIPPEQQAYVAFRRNFSLDSLPNSAQLKIFADTRYMLWINGTYVERGPCRFDPSRPEYDILKVDEYLQPGDNAVVVLVHNYPIDNFNEWYLQCARMMEHDPGLTAVLTLENADGRARRITTDGDWKCSSHTRFLPSAGTYSSIPDSIDARRDPGDWTQVQFDDSEWQPAVQIDGTKWGRLHPRAIPLLREQVLVPESIVREISDGDTINDIRPFKNRLPYEVSRGGQLIIDVGRPVQGYPVLDLSATEGSTLKMDFAARFFDTGREPSSALAEHVQNTYIARAGRQTYMTTDTFGFKYLILDVTSGSILIHDLRVVDRRYPFVRLGSFTSSDSTLNRIWAYSVNTVELCSEDAYVDCADRERAQWLGDAVVIEYPVTRVTQAGPGDAPGEYRDNDSRLLRNMLRHVALSQLPDGRVQPMRPSEYPPENRHGVIDDYSCLWVEGILEYYRRTGDGDFVQEMWPHVMKLMNYFLERRTERGLVKAQEFIFFHNPLIYQLCEGASINAFIHKALQDAAELGTIVNDTSQSHRFADAADALYTSYNTYLWDEETRSYFGSVTDGNPTPPTGHAAVLVLYYDMVPSGRKASTLKYAQKQFPAEAPFPYTYKFYLDVLYDMDNPGVDKNALSIIRQKWKHMTRYETGTVSEDFDGGSYLHNAGAAPAYFLSAFVLGVRTVPAQDELHLVIEPHLADLDWVRGRVVTEYGLVPVAWERRDNALEFRVVIPDGIDGRVKIPRISESPTLSINGQTFISPEDSREEVELGDNYITFPLTPGEYSGRIR